MPERLPGSQAVLDGPEPDCPSPSVFLSLSFNPLLSHDKAEQRLRRLVVAEAVGLVLLVRSSVPLVQPACEVANDEQEQGDHAVRLVMTLRRGP